MTRAEIEKAARSYIGVPFRHQGRARWGMDCAGLLYRVMEDVGVQPRHTATYELVPPEGLLTFFLEEQFDRIAGDPLLPGDVVVFRVDRIHDQHLAIKTTIGYVHTYRSVGMVVETAGVSPRWERTAAWRFRGLELV